MCVRAQEPLQSQGGGGEGGREKDTKVCVCVCVCARVHLACSHVCATCTAGSNADGRASGGGARGGQTLGCLSLKVDFFPLFLVRHSVDIAHGTGQTFAF